MDPKILDIINSIVDGGSALKVIVIRALLVFIIGFILLRVKEFNTENIAKSKIVQIESLLRSVATDLPATLVVGVEGIESTRLRDAYWISDEKAFKSLTGNTLSDYNSQGLQYAKAYAKINDVCNHAPTIANEETNRGYYVCPINIDNETVGVIWVLYRTKPGDSTTGQDVEMYVKPMLMEIKRAIEEDG